MITYEERRSGRRPTGGDTPSNEVPLLVVAYDGEEEEAVKTYLEGDLPATLDGLKLKSVHIEETLQPGSMYLATATYGSASETKETGESTYSFDTTGGTFHISQSKQTIAKYAASGTAPDLKGAINVNAEGTEAEGTDITIPQFAFSETHYIANEDVTETYANTLFALTGHTNNGAFRGLSAGECLFLGARGTRRGRGDWEITFEFAASPNVTGLTIGAIAAIAKKGWEYLWVRYEATDGTGANKKLVPSPKHVYVERVYDDGDFDLLGI